MCHGEKSRFFWDGRPPTFNDGILIMAPYKPLRTWVDEYSINGSLDPGTYSYYFGILPSIIGIVFLADLLN